MTEKQVQQAQEQAQIQQEQAAQAQQPGDQDEDFSGPANAKERFYEMLIRRFRITKKGMDVVLVVLLVLFVLFFVVGALKGNGLL